MVISRISSHQQFTDTRGRVLFNQSQLIEDTTRLNTGKRILRSYDAPIETTRTVELDALITQKDQEAKTKEIAISELELAESSLISMKEIIDQIKENAVQGGSDTLDAQDRENLGKQLRTQAETIIQLSNAKLGNKHLFSGIESDVPTVDLNPDAAFDTAIYKANKGETGERMIGDKESSVSLNDLFNIPSSSASVTGTVNNPVNTGDIVLIIDDGNGNIINTGDINLAADNLANTIAKINAAFAAAGGAGAIAQENPIGFLNLDTALVTGNTTNSNAKITIVEGTAPGTALTDLGLAQGTSQGISGDLLETLNKLEVAYKSDDSATVRDTIIDIDINIDRINEIRARLGNITENFNKSLNKDKDLSINLDIERSGIEDIPIAEAINNVSLSQTIVNNSLNMATSIFQQNVFDFLNL